MTFISLKVFLVDVLEILNVLSIKSMDDACIASLGGAGSVDVGGVKCNRFDYRLPCIHG